MAGTSNGARGSLKNVKYSFPGLVVTRHSISVRNSFCPRTSFAPRAEYSPNSSPNGDGPAP